MSIPYPEPVEPTGKVLSVEQIDALLPQTQCGQCTYPGCKPYAQALFDGLAEVNLCPPGGTAGMRRLAALLKRPPKALTQAESVKQSAIIDETLCIGCTLCIQACPVDAIVGAAQYMHSVIEAYCTGCALCIAPCPVACISLLAQPTTQQTVSSFEHPAEMSHTERAFANAAKTRFEFRQLRLARAKQEKAEQSAKQQSTDINKLKSATIAAAIERARQQRNTDKN
ncbi:MAG: RnfABCDGE type electron transport complex subunit B [Pseudomonadota bacterium]